MRNYIHVAIRGAKINNVVAVSRVLEKFDSRPPMMIANNGGPRLALEQEGWESFWLSAVHIDELPNSNAFKGHDLAREAEERLHDNKGAQGFLDLLLALAPYLDVPLTIQAADFDSAGAFYRAAEWTVRPGATAVEFKEIVAISDE